jgi:phage protein D
MTSTAKQGLPPTSYYAPGYKLEVNGQSLPAEVIGDVLEVKVVLDIENMSSFELNVSNWDDAKLKFKYSDTPTFDLGRRVHVQMGYADRLLSMIIGQISTMSPKFPETGSPTISITGIDGMLQLKDSKPKAGETKKYVDMADWEIAQAVAARNKLRCVVTAEGEKHPLVIQKNQDDAQFLKERAARIDYECFILTDQDSGEDTLYFIHPKDGRSSDKIRVYEFEWGENLIQFNPTLTLNSQVGSVTVRGWDPRKKEAIVYNATSADIKGEQEQGTNGADAAKQNLGNRQDVVVDAPVSTEQEARDLATSLLRERAYNFIKGTGKVIGLPDLRPGDNVVLKGLGDRFSGSYYVKKVEHVLNSETGYLSTFEVRRVHDGGAK